MSTTRGIRRSMVSWEAPVLSLALDAVSKVEGEDGVCGLLTRAFPLPPSESNPLCSCVSIPNAHLFHLLQSSLLKMQTRHTRGATAREHGLEALAP